MGRLERLLEALDYDLCLPLVGRLPFPLAYFLARRRGDVRRLLQPATRRRVASHLAEILGRSVDSAETRVIVREWFMVRSSEEVEAVFFPRLTAGTLAGLIEYEGLEHLDTALAEGNGGVLYTPHAGSFCLFLVGLGLLGYRVNPVARSIEVNNPLPGPVRRYARKKIRWMNAAMGRPFLETHTYLRSLYRVLERNELLFVLTDTPAPLVRRRVSVRFFGRPTLLPAGVASVAARVGAPWLGFTVERRADWSRQRAKILPPSWPTGDPAVDLQRCAEVMEAAIRARPSQWLLWDSASTLWEGGLGATYTWSRSEKKA